MSNILQIETPTQFEDFQRRYGMYNNTSRTYNKIEWNNVQVDYKGIQICPFMYKTLEDFEAENFVFKSQEEKYNFQMWQQFYFKSSWYHGWDVASGCVWDTSAILDVIPVARKKNANSKFHIMPALKKIQVLQRNRNIHKFHDIPDMTHS